MAIAPYKGGVEVTAPRPFSTDLPQVADVGPAFSGVTRTLAAAAEPQLEYKAQEQAISDAGAASIVRTPDGQYVRSNITHGGGLVYAKAYGDALDTRQMSIMTQDYATSLQQTAQQWADDPAHQNPTEFWSFASGQAKAMLEAAPLSMRAKLDGHLAQLMGDSARGFSEAVHATQRRQLGQGLEQSLTNYETEIANLAKSDGSTPDIEKRVGQAMENAFGVIHQMRTLGFIGEEQPFVDGLTARTYDERSYVAGSQAMLGFGRILPHLSDEQLARVKVWGEGSDDGGTISVLTGAKDKDGKDVIQQVTRQQFSQMFGGNTRWLGAAGSLADQVLSLHIQQANQQAYLDALNKPKPMTTAEAKQQLKDDRANPFTGLTETQVVSLDMNYGKQGTPAEQLASPDGVVRTLGFIAQTGRAPEATDTALRAMIMSSDPNKVGQAFDFIQQAKNITTSGGGWAGRDFFNSLPADVRAMADFDETMRRNGYDATTRIREILDQKSGQNLGYGKMVEIWGKESDYRKHAHAAIQQAFGIDPSQLSPQMQLKLDHDFDQLARLNVQLYQGQPEQALVATANSLTNGWAKSDIFVGGIGDRKLIGLGIPTSVWDMFLKGSPSLRAANPTGALFSNGRVRLQAMDDAPSGQFPNYQLVFYDANGNRLTGARGAILPVQKVVDMWHKRTEVEQQAAARKALDETPPARVIVGKMQNGNVGFIPNPNYDAWVKAHPPKPSALTDTHTGVFGNDNLRRYGMVRY